MVYLAGFESDVAGAIGSGGPLGLPAAIDIVVPPLADALDGDPPQARPDRFMTMTPLPESP